MNQKPSVNHTASNSFLGMKLTDYIAIVVRGKWRVLSVFLVVLMTAIGLTLLMKPTYESTVSLLVDTRSSPSALFQDARTLSMTVDIIQNEMALLSSRSVARGVADQLIKQKYIDSVRKVLYPVVLPIEGDTVNPTIASPATVMARMAKTVTFGSERESYVISITATSTNPKEAAIIATTYAQQYLEHNIFTSRAKSRSFREFLGHQVSEKQEALRQKEDSLQTYMQRRGVVSLDDETKILMDQMATLEAQRDANDIEIRSLLTQLSSYKGQIDQQEKSIAKSIGQASDTYIRLLQGQLAQLEVQRDITVAQNRSAAGQGINNERIKEIDNQIADLRQKLQNRTQEYVQDILPASDQPSSQDDPTGYLKQIKQKFIETQITIQTLQAKRDAMSEALIQYERQFAKVPSKSVEYARLLREKVSMEQLYSLLEGKYNEANVTEQSEFGSVEVFDPAVVPLEPTSPNIFLNAALGVILGMGMGIGYVFAREFFSQRLYSPEDLVRRGFVPLSIIGVPDKKRAKGMKGQDGSGGREYTYRLAMTSSFSRITEAFRHLRTNLQAANNGVSPKTIMVTSPDPGEGKTTIACNLAVVLAQGGRKVLLVDADLREPAVYVAFGMDAKTGLAQILSGKSGSDPLIRDSHVPNLHVLCSGHSTANAAELLESADMKFFVSQVAERYDVVVFDSPPVLAVSDALILSTMVDCVIVVVSAGTTMFSSLQRATDMLSNVGAKIAGIVLNKFDAQNAYGSFTNVSGYGYYGYAERYGTNGDGKRHETSKRVS